MSKITQVGISTVDREERVGDQPDVRNNNALVVVLVAWSIGRFGLELLCSA